jgi:hypothetical protein
MPEGIQPDDHVMAIRAAGGVSAADPAPPLPEDGMSIADGRTPEARHWMRILRSSPRWPNV